MTDVRLTMEPDAATLGAHIRGLGRKIDKASTLAISTATRQTGSEARRILRDKTALQQKYLKNRVYTDSKVKGRGKIWVGLNRYKAAWWKPLTPRDMNPEQQADLPGSYAQDFFFKGAFVARMESGHLGIFKRTGKKHTPTHGSYAGKNYKRKTGPVQREILHEQYISARALGLVTQHDSAEYLNTVADIGEMVRRNQALYLDKHLEQKAGDVLQREFVRQMERKT